MTASTRTGMGTRSITFGSVCSGIEAASVAWHPLGWTAAWLSEIEPFPSAVLAHHYPTVPNHGDMTKLPAKVMTGEIPAPDVLVGGTPCQAFSVAGMREGLNDPRGQLAIKYVELADAIDFVRERRGDQPSIIVWENVPGVLSDKGNAFGCFLGALSGEDCELQPAGGKWSDAGCVFGPQRAIAWRILDAQFFGLAQRRRRVFVVASARNDIHPAQLLFEFDGMRRDSAPSRETGEGIAAGTLRSTDGGSDVDHARAGHLQPIHCLAHGQGGAELRVDSCPTLTCNHEAPIIAGTLQASGKAAGSVTQQDAESGLLVVHGTQDPLISDKAFALGRNNGQENAVFAIPFDTTQITSKSNVSSPKYGDPCHPLAVGAHAPAIAVSLRGRDGGATAELGDEINNCLRASQGGGDKPHVLSRMSVRRLMPVECEKLQGFMPGYTQVPYRNKPAADSPRYKALGNSMAVPCMAFIGNRIQQYTSQTKE